SNVLVTETPADAARRVRAYEEAGAEAIWLTRATPEGIEALHRGTTIPLILGGRLWTDGVWSDRSFKDPEVMAFLSENGVRIANTGNTQMRALVKTYFDSYTALRDGRNDDLESMAVSMEQFNEVTRLSRDNDHIASFLN